MGMISLPLVNYVSDVSSASSSSSAPLIRRLYTSHAHPSSEFHLLESPNFISGLAAAGEYSIMIYQINAQNFLPVCFFFPGSEMQESFSLKVLLSLQNPHAEPHVKILVFSYSQVI